MKKLLSLLLVFLTLFSAASCSQNPIDAVTMKLNDTEKYDGCQIKLAADKNAEASYTLSPEGFDWDALERKGYSFRISVTYDVYYEKDWSIGVGYLGSPKYEITLLASDGTSKSDENLGTTENAVTKSLSITQSPDKVKDAEFTLTFSTDNIQNIIHFENITVKYECIKQ